MISTCGSPPALMRCDGGLGDGADLQREQAGHDQAEAHAAQAQHRVRLVQALDGGEQREVASASGSPVGLGDARPGPTSSVRSGRNSCSGGSSSRIVTGSPSIALEQLDEVLALQRQQRGERGVAVVVGRRRGSPARSARGGRRGTCARCGTGRCPRRRGARARAASSAVSALARTRSRRVSSAWASSRSTAVTSAAVSSSASVERGVEAVLEVGHHRATATTGTAPRKTSPVEPSMRITSPSSDGDVADARGAWRRTSTSSSSAPHTQVLPMPRATTAACDGLAAARGQDAGGGDHALEVVGVGLRRTRMTSSPRSAHALAVAESNTALPTAAPGEAAMPLVSSVACAGRVELREHQLRELRAGDPVERLVLGDQVLVDELAWRSGTPPPRCACRRGSAASTACRARW